MIYLRFRMALTSVTPTYIIGNLMFSGKHFQLDVMLKFGKMSGVQITIEVVHCINEKIT